MYPRDSIAMNISGGRSPHVTDNIKGGMSMKESILNKERTLSIVDKREILFASKAFILRVERFTKALLASRWLERMDKYWEDCEKKCLLRKWQSFRGHWF